MNKAKCCQLTVELGGKLYGLWCFLVVVEGHEPHASLQELGEGRVHLALQHTSQ